MYQASLFSNNVHNTAKYLDAGMFSKVFLMTNGDIIKVGRNDRTRNWLEFCALHTAAGTLMPMMPEVYSVVSLNDGMYTATMKAYVSWEKETGSDWGAHDEYGCVYDFNDRPDVIAVRKAFAEYLLAAGWVPCVSGYEDELSYNYRRVFNDLHHGNVMFDDGLAIITDPSAGDYYVMTTVPAFELH